jgi:hypothetical protein
MVVSWAATQLGCEDSEQGVGCCGLVGRGVQLPRDVRSDRTKIGADRLTAGGHSGRRWTAVLGVDARR